DGADGHVEEIGQVGVRCAEPAQLERLPRVRLFVSSRLAALASLDLGIRAVAHRSHRGLLNGSAANVMTKPSEGCGDAFFCGSCNERQSGACATVRDTTIANNVNRFSVYGFNLLLSSARTCSALRLGGRVSS